MGRTVNRSRFIYQLYNSKYNKLLDVTLNYEEAKRYLLTERHNNRDIEDGWIYFAQCGGYDTISLSDLDRSKRVANWYFL